MYLIITFAIVLSVLTYREGYTLGRKHGIEIEKIRCSELCRQSFHYQYSPTVLWVLNSINKDLIELDLKDKIAK